MATLTFPRGQTGWVIPVLIGLDHQASLTVARNELSVPAPVLALAQLDSGSDISCVSSAILRQLPLISRGTQSTQTVSGTAFVRMFDVSLSIIPNSGQSGMMLTIPDLMIMELPQPIPNVDVLIGLDVLDRSKTILDGPRQLLTIEF